MRYKTCMSDTDKNTDDNVYDASWAPTDPRDAHSDKGEGAARFGDGRVGSKVRILGVMHPVLNLFVLAFDSIINRSRLATWVLILILAGLLLIFWLSGAFSGWK